MCWRRALSKRTCRDVFLLSLGPPCAFPVSLVRLYSVFSLYSYASAKSHAAAFASAPRFYKALTRAVGVLVVLDPTARAFTRIWCAFEEAMVVDVEGRRKARLRLDLATVHKGSARLLVDGMTPGEVRTDEKDDASGVLMKAAREAR